MLGELREFVQQLGGVQHVEVNPVTGSIVVHYQPESHADISNLLQRAQQEEQQRQPQDGFEQPPELTDADALADQIEKEAEFLAAHSELALHVVNAVKSLNTSIREATGNTVDLKVLLPAGLAVWAFFKAGADVSTPLWVTLGIFSFNSFVALHRPTTAHLDYHVTKVDPQAAG